MTNFASQTAVDPRSAEDLAREVAELRGIYERLFPTQNLRIILFQGQDPVWGAPIVVEDPFTATAATTRPELLGTLMRPGAHPGAGEVTVLVSVPRAPTPAERRITDAPWRPNGRLGPLYRLHPMAYEEVRFRAEMLRKRLSHRRHPTTRIPFGAGSPALARPEAATTDARPAILIGMHWLEVGGAEKLGFDTIEWALAAGLRVFVVASVPALQRLADRLPQHPDVQLIRLDRYLPAHLWPRYVEALVRDENIRLIHIHHCTPLYDSLPQLRVFCPWVKVIDSTHVIEYADGGYPRTSGVWSDFIDIHHVISADLVRYYRDRFQVVSKVRMGRMLDRHPAGAEPPQPRLTVGQKTLHASFVGRLYYQKRPLVVVAALRALAAWARKNDVVFTATMVGEGPFEDACARLLQRYGIADQVTRLPGNADVPALLSRSDILLLPSNNEGLALVCYEAIDHGCIPISTDVGSQSEIVPADLLVPLAPRAAVRAIVAAVDRMWRDPEFLTRQKDALLRARSRLSADVTARDVLMPIYRKVAGTLADTPKGDAPAAAPLAAPAQIGG